jgi:hypothetical protein
MEEKEERKRDGTPLTVARYIVGIIDASETISE